MLIVYTYLNIAVHMFLTWSEDHTVTLISFRFSESLFGLKQLDSFLISRFNKAISSPDRCIKQNYCSDGGLFDQFKSSQLKQDKSSQCQ